MDWYYADDAGGQHPVAGESLPSLVASGRIRRDTLVWNETMTAWAVAASALPDLFSAVPPQLSPEQRRGIMTGGGDFFAPPQAKTDPVAVCALVFGVLGLPVCLPFFSIPAIICGHIARKRAKEEAVPSANAGLALGGLIMGYVGFVVMMAVILFYVGIIGFAIATEGAAGEAPSP
jgi:hypothetical protein